jgi:hydroxymethylglutaryl-CoA lyase
MRYPAQVEVVEVGPRDGFQMEPSFIPTEQKIEIINGLIEAGVRRMEATSFVSPKAIPQLADAEAVLAGVKRREGVTLAALVPNQKRAERAAAAGVDEMVVFVSASETHNRNNLNRSVAETLAGFDEVAATARRSRIALRGVIAVSFGCPYEGEVAMTQVRWIADRLVDLGVCGLSLGDTTGMATPPLIEERCGELMSRHPGLDVALHLHNTRGIALANVVVGLELGVKTVESSIGGLGGCPFAPGATGNVCTEDLVYLLDEMGIATGIDLGRLIAVAKRAETVVGHALPGQVMKAGERLRRSIPAGAGQVRLS